MPGHHGVALKADVLNGKVSYATIDDSVARILAQMYKFGLFDNMNQWNGSTHQHDVTPCTFDCCTKRVGSWYVLLKNENGSCHSTRTKR